MPSYLLKNRNGNSYTRIPFPQSLRLLGCPLEISVSLLKDRSEATLRNLVAAHGIKLLMNRLATYPAAILMTDGYACYKHALGERVDGILTRRVLLQRPRDLVQARVMASEAVHIYNAECRHHSLK